MTTSPRRVFIQVAAVSGAALLSNRGFAQSGAPKLEESDPQATGLGYKADASKVDKAKYPQHTAEQMCGGCNFFQGKPADAMAPCQIFGGKQVSAKGWCTAWVKRAG